MTMVIISDALVRSSITPDECLAAVEDGFRRLAHGQVIDTYASLHSEADAASLHLYGATVAQVGTGAKILGAYEHNPERALPFIRAVVLLLDPNTGDLQAVLDGAYLTCLRTAAATALGARHLARPDSRVLAIVGTGAQARTHLLCHLRLHDYEKVLVWGRTPAHVSAYVAEMAPLIAAPIRVAESADDMVAEADVITCVTSARQPLFSAGAVRPGTHIGVCAPMNPTRSEVPLQLLTSSTLVVDSRRKFSEQWVSDLPPPVHGELGEVMIGRIPGRQKPSEITIFKPEGMAFEDVVSARIVLQNVERDGTAVNVEW